MARVLTTMIAEVHAPTHEEARAWLAQTANEGLRATTPDGEELLAAIRAAMASGVPATKEDEEIR